MTGVNGTPHPGAGGWMKPGHGIQDSGRGGGGGGSSKKGGCLRVPVAPVVVALIALVVTR